MRGKQMFDIGMDREELFALMLLAAVAQAREEMAGRKPIDLDDVFDRFNRGDFTMKEGIVAVIGLSIYAGKPVTGIDPDWVSTVTEKLYEVMWKDAPCCDDPRCEPAALWHAIQRYNAG